MVSMIRIGLIQMRCEKGAINKNLEGLSRHLGEADMRDIDIIGFPEMSITGFTNPIKYPESIQGSEDEHNEYHRFKERQGNACKGTPGGSTVNLRCLV